MSYLRSLSGIVLATAAIAGYSSPPAQADATWTLTADVINPTSTITGGWVTPIGTTGPPRSPGANVAFQSKHSASATGGTPNDSFVVTMYNSLNYGVVYSPNSDASVNAINGVDSNTVSSLETETGSVKFNSSGEWHDSAYQNVSVSKTVFVSPLPNITPTPRYVSDAQTSLSVTGGTSVSPSPVHDYQAFTVTPPTGGPPP
jgi:hypothetical protein